MKSALQQALSAIGSAGNKLAIQKSGAGKKLIDSKMQAARETLERLNSLMRKRPIKEVRISKGSVAVATDIYGNVIYSDGSIKNPNTRPKNPTEMRELNIMRQNLLQQVPYTPEAEAIIKSANLDTYGHLGPVSSEENLSGGFAGPDAGMSINRNALSYGGKTPTWGSTSGAEIMSHEVLHFLDDNLAGRSRTNGNIANSYKFGKHLKKWKPKAYESILKGPLNTKELYDSENERTQDVEMFAYTGQQGPKVLLNTPGNKYDRVYMPMSKNINFSPKYPTQEYYNGMRPNSFGRTAILKED